MFLINKSIVMSQDSIKKLGELLRDKRRELNLSLKEVENATSIRMGYLKALEEGDVAQLISPIYAQGFLRQYALFLGLDGEELIRENPLPAIKQEFSYGIGTMEVRGNPGAGVKWLPNAVGVVAFASILFLGWAFARYLEVL